MHAVREGQSNRLYRHIELYLITAKMEATSLEPVKESVLTSGLGTTDRSSDKKTPQERRLRKKGQSYIALTHNNCMLTHTTCVLTGTYA